MANVLTDLAADIYKAADIVGREQVGFIPSVTINQVANVMIPWTGEDIRSVNNGAGYETIYGDQIAQAMRGIVNTIEAYLGGVVYKGASRAVGAAGTTPFGSNFDIVAEARQVLIDNGMPQDGQTTMVLNTTAGTKLRNLAQLQKANEAGGTQLLRQGTLLDLQGMMIKESVLGVQSHTKGTGASKLVNGALSAGATTITTDGGSGTIVVGDVVTFAADTVNKYVVTGELASGSFTIAAPGLRVDIPDNNAITVGNNYAGNAAFHRAAVELVVRPPAQPQGGDAAVDRMTVQDPFSGLVFEMAAYKGYGKSMLDITTFYDAKVWKEDFVTAVMG